MSVRDLPEFDDHELVLFGSDRKSGLKYIIAVHNMNRGPATGGTRYWHYSSEEDALRDALKLSKAMTYKCALAGLPYGGGKGVIIADPKKPKTKEMLLAYASNINLLCGNFTTGEDVGMTEHDIAVMASKSPYIHGRVGFAGDLGPWAALGVFSAIRAGLEAVFESPDIKGRTFAIKGIGKVGMALTKLIHENGGSIIGADIKQNVVRIAKRRFPKMKIVSPAQIHRQNVDVYAPCALGNDFSAKTIAQLRCKIVCGGANNQLVTEKDGERLHKAGILYIPDYLANAGGLIDIAGEMRKGGYDRSWVRSKVMAIQATAEEVIRLSKKARKSMSEIADRLAEQKFKRRA